MLPRANARNLAGFRHSAVPVDFLTGFGYPSCWRVTHVVPAHELERAAGGGDRLTGDPPAVVRGEKRHDVRDVLRLAEPAERRLVDDLLDQVGLTAQQVELLCVLQAQTPALGELAEMFGCDKTNITGMADRLTRRGLVDRTTDPADRRVTRLALTDDGARFAIELKAQVAGRVEERWRALSATDRATIVGLKST